MITNRDYNHLSQAISLKSVLQEVAAREAGITTDELIRKTPTTLSVKDLEGNHTVQVGFEPQSNQLVMLKDSDGESVYGRIVIPDSPSASTSPYIQKLTPEEAESLKGTRHAIKVIQTAKKIAPTPTKLPPTRKMPIFLEPAERLIFSVYNRILHMGSREHNPGDYITELILILILASLAIVVMWFSALSAM